MEHPKAYSGKQKTFIMKFAITNFLFKIDSFKRPLVKFYSQNGVSSVKLCAFYDHIWSRKNFKRAHIKLASKLPFVKISNQLLTNRTRKNI